MSVVGNMKVIDQVRELLSELMLGREDPDGFFCLCLSLLGDTDTRTLFLDLIKPLLPAHEHLHSPLTAMFLDYFSKVMQVSLIRWFIRHPNCIAHSLLIDFNEFLVVSFKYQLNLTCF